MLCWDKMKTFPLKLTEDNHVKNDLIMLIMFAVSRPVSSTEFGDLETLCKAVINEKQPFERLEISKETLLKMFKVRTRALISTHSLGFCAEKIGTGQSICPVLEISHLMKQV